MSTKKIFAKNLGFTLDREKMTPTVLRNIESFAKDRGATECGITNDGQVIICVGQKPIS